MKDNPGWPGPEYKEHIAIYLGHRLVIPESFARIY